jgi:hypothetical protein
MLLCSPHAIISAPRVGNYKAAAGWPIHSAIFCAHAQVCLQEQIALLQEWRIASTDVERQVIPVPLLFFHDSFFSTWSRSIDLPLTHSSLQFGIQRIEAEKQFLSV